MITKGRRYTTWFWPEGGGGSFERHDVNNKTFDSYRYPCALVKCVLYIFLYFAHVLYAWAYKYLSNSNFSHGHSLSNDTFDKLQLIKRILKLLHFNLKHLFLRVYEMHKFDKISKLTNSKMCVLWSSLIGIWRNLK